MGKVSISRTVLNDFVYSLPNDLQVGQLDRLCPELPQKLHVGTFPVPARLVLIIAVELRFSMLDFKRLICPPPVPEPGTTAGRGIVP